MGVNYLGLSFDGTCRFCEVIMIIYIIYKVISIIVNGGILTLLFKRGLKQLIFGKNWGACEFIVWFFLLEGESLGGILVVIILSVI